MSIKKIDAGDRNFTLDALRGIAAFFVMLFHFNENDMSRIPIYGEFVKYGWLGVPVFFILSGYFIALTQSRDQNIKVFMTKRLFRIYPPYLLSLAIVLLVVCLAFLLFGVNNVTKLPDNPLDWLLTILLMIKPLTWVDSINWVYWTLVYELLFYITFALCSIRMDWQRPALIAVTLAAMLPLGLEETVFFFMGSWSLFTLGVGLYFYFQKNDFFSYLLIALSVLGVCFKQKPEVWIATVITVAMIFYSKNCQWDYLKRPTLLSKLGEASYGLYLLHVPLGVYGLLLVERYFSEYQYWPRFAIQIISALIVCRISYFVFVKYEVPFISLGRKCALKFASPSIAFASTAKKEQNS